MIDLNEGMLFFVMGENPAVLAARSAASFAIREHVGDNRHSHRGILRACPNSVGVAIHFINLITLLRTSCNTRRLAPGIAPSRNSAARCNGLPSQESANLLHWSSRLLCARYKGLEIMAGVFACKTFSCLYLCTRLLQAILHTCTHVALTV